MDSDDRNTTAHRFALGDIVALRSDPAARLPVVEVIPGLVECRYVVFQDNHKVTYYESQLQAVVDNEEEEPLVSITDLRAYLTSLHILSPSTAHLFSLRLGRVQFVPYQYRPVLKLIRADRPRLLIADEVGVGKTIEAGLIIKELRARMDLASILIICPKALVAERKWFVEMKRFDEQFTALDGPLLRHCLQETDLDGEWPSQYAKAIVPFSLFDSDLVFGKGGRNRRKSEGLLDLDSPPRFDLVIVDEAHHIRNPETYLHQGVRYFCDNAEAVIFLTATPVQLGSEDLFTLLNVLRPDLVIDRASFEQMAAPNRAINAAVQHCRTARDGWQREARRCLDEAVRTEWGQLFLRGSTAFQSVEDQLQENPINDEHRVALIRCVEELYTFSGLINRTRRRDIGEFTTRRAETLEVAFTPDQQRLHDNLLAAVARILGVCHGQQNIKFMMTTIRRQAASCIHGLTPLLRRILAGKFDVLEAMEAADEDWDFDASVVDEIRADIEALLERASELEPHDPKVEALIDVLRGRDQMANNKALIFSTFRHTLAYLSDHLNREGLRFGMVHGDVPDDERAALRRRFALPSDDPAALDILLSSEVGSEGLDFQFCDLLVNYDLPWNPMRVEQRIGRIDRYGQKSESIAIINMITPGTVDADIYERCLWRIGIFQHAVGGNEEILGEITQAIHEIADSFALTPGERAARLQQLADNSIRELQEAADLESKEGQLFGLAVPKQTWQQEIENAESHWLSPVALQHCVDVYLSEILESESESLLGEKPLKTLRLSRDARRKLLDDFNQWPYSTDAVTRQWEKWLKGPEPMLAVTFDQETAAAAPDAVHLSVLHPLVRQAAAFLERARPAYVSLEVDTDVVPTGVHRFALYRWRKRGARDDAVLVAVADTPTLDAHILDLLETAVDWHAGAALDQGAIQWLDSRHHDLWSGERERYVAENRREVEQRVQSFAVSHRARRHVLKEQLGQATNDNIRRMKAAELARAEADYEERQRDLSQTADRADIQATPVVFGLLHVTRGDPL